MRPLAGMLVVDLTRYLPGAYASRELLELGARVVHVEAPEGDPMRHVAPAWERGAERGQGVRRLRPARRRRVREALCAGARTSCSRASGPGVAARLGVGPDDVPERIVYCSITGFGSDGPHVARAGHDLNYLGWAGVLADTAPAVPPLQPADLAAGALGAVTQVLAALLERERTGRGARLTVSMTHGSHRLVAHRLGGDPLPRFLTGGLACYRIYETADGRHLTVGALEPKFFARLCELVGRPELASRQFDRASRRRSRPSSARSSRRARSPTWLELFDGEDVCVGPVATLDEAAGVRLAQLTPRRPGRRAHRRLAARARVLDAAPGPERPGARTGPAAGRARPGCSPSRSSRNACIPSARAPSMSSS